MNAAETKAYKKLTTLAHKDKIAKAATEAMHRSSEARFKALCAARKEQNARMEPVHKALRSAASSSPEFAGVRDAIATLAKKKHPAPKLRPISRVPAPKSPHLKLGSVHLVDTPPFFGSTWLSLQGSANSPFGSSADGSTGDMSIFIIGGYDSGGNGGSGSASTWTGIGQNYSPPNDGFLRFTANPSFSWEADWASMFWRQAAGDCWIGLAINRFDSNGTFIDAPVETQISLESYNDYNLSDWGETSGSSSGMALEVDLFVESDMIYSCWVWMGGDVTADGYNAQSIARINMQANVSSLVLDLF